MTACQSESIGQLGLVSIKARDVVDTDFKWYYLSGKMILSMAFHKMSIYYKFNVPLLKIRK